MGGLNALRKLLVNLPESFPLPLAVVQHRSKSENGDLAAFLQKSCVLPVMEVEDKDAIACGCVHLAPADYHLLVDRAGFALSTEAPVECARPSIDVLFESAADIYGAGTIGVVLTGSSRDGAQGAARIKERDGLLIVQDPASAECAIMPAAVKAGCAPDEVLALEEIGPHLVEFSCGMVKV